MRRRSGCSGGNCQSSSGKLSRGRARYLFQVHVEGVMAGQGDQKSVERLSCLQDGQALAEKALVAQASPMTESTLKSLLLTKRSKERRVHAGRFQKPAYPREARWWNPFCLQAEAMELNSFPA